MPFDSGTAIAVAVPLLLLPSEVGALIPSHEADFVLGWSWQIPVAPSFRHRIAGSLDWVPGYDGRHFRGRLGYRFGLRHFFTGLGPSFDRSGATWSPVFGVKFAHAEGADEQIDLSLHIVVRADISPAVDGFRAITMLFGWNAL